MPPLVLAITGGSGAIYALRLLEVLIARGREVELTLSPAAVEVIHQELGLEVNLANFDPQQLLPPFGDFDAGHLLNQFTRVATEAPGSIRYQHFQDWRAGMASGSHRTAGMVICPCSLGTLGAIAAGLSQNIIHRAAEVHLKERRKLIVMPRETPLSSIALGNMQRLADLGVVVMPAAPGFYHHPTSIADLVDFVVSRICDQLDIDWHPAPRWGAR